MLLEYLLGLGRQLHLLPHFYSRSLLFLQSLQPVLLLLFVVFGSLGGWIAARTGQPLIAAACNALLFGWLLAVSFPVVDR